MRSARLKYLKAPSETRWLKMLKSTLRRFLAFANENVFSPIIPRIPMLANWSKIRKAGRIIRKELQGNHGLSAFKLKRIIPSLSYFKPIFKLGFPHFSILPVRFIQIGCSVLE